jgi:hypothetical protein
MQHIKQAPFITDDALVAVVLLNTVFIPRSTIHPL